MRHYEVEQPFSWIPGAYIGEADLGQHGRRIQPPELGVARPGLLVVPLRRGRGQELGYFLLFGVFGFLKHTWGKKSRHQTAGETTHLVGSEIVVPRAGGHVGALAERPLGVGIGENGGTGKTIGRTTVQKKQHQSETTRIYGYRQQRERLLFKNKLTKRIFPLLGSLWVVSSVDGRTKTPARFRLSSRCGHWWGGGATSAWVRVRMVVARSCRARHHR